MGNMSVSPCRPDVLGSPIERVDGHGVVAQCRHGRQSGADVESAASLAVAKPFGEADPCAGEASLLLLSLACQVDFCDLVQVELIASRSCTIDAAKRGSMIRYRTGDILAEDAEALVNAVNCVGVMGRGIALQFKKAFPENFREYANACERGEVCPGSLFVFETGQLTNPRYIINFPTKRHWRGKSRVEDIEAGLKALAELIRKRSIRSIAVPPLGCGLGGLDWLEVRSLIEEALGGVNDLDTVVFEPQAAPEAANMVRSREAPT